MREYVKKANQIRGLFLLFDEPRQGLSGGAPEQDRDVHSGISVTTAEGGKPAGAQLGNGAGAKVMVIDDSQTIRKTAETLLMKEGYSVITAADGFEALCKVADHQPDVIFIDIMMPRLDGYQACALIKANAQYNRTPIIMLSSKDGLFDRARGRIVGSDEYLTKPFTKDELLGAVRAQLARKAA